MTGFPFSLPAEPESLDAHTASLLERARAGDQQAFDALFACVAEQALLFVRLRLGPRLRGKLEPMDILQEGYLDAFKAFERFEYKGQGSFARWLCRIIENRIRGRADHFGAAKRRAPGGTVRVTGIIERARADATGPATAAGRNEAHERLARAMEQLEEAERSVLLLRFFQERTIEQIAAELETSPTSARRLLGRATTRLGVLLDQPERPAGG